MADFNESYRLLTQAEFSNKPEKFLHQNPNEEFVTLGGVYQKWHQLAVDWNFVHDVIRLCNRDLKRASVMLYNDKKTYKEVYEFFRKVFWCDIRIDEIHSQIIADNLFLSAVHIGQKNAIKIAQRTVGVVDDGIIGNITIKALNNYNQDLFKVQFDTREVENYMNIIDKNPNLAYAEDGFLSRSRMA